MAGAKSKPERCRQVLDEEGNRLVDFCVLDEVVVIEHQEDPPRERVELV